MQFVEKEKHVEGLIEKLTIRLEQTANLAGTAPATQASRPPIPIKDSEVSGSTQNDPATVPDESAPITRVQETISCLSHAIGAMNYTDRCILRLHDAVVVRKALHTAISYHAVARECLLAIVEKGRRPKPGFLQKGTQDGSATMEAPDGVANADVGGGGKGSAASAALDAIEQTISALVQGAREEEDLQPIGDGEAGEGGGVVLLPTAATAQSLPSKIGKAGRGIKRKTEKEADLDNPGFDEEHAGSKPGGGRGSRGSGRGKGRGRGRGTSAEEKENSKPKDQSHTLGEGAKPGKAAGKKRRTRQTDDDSE